jgi:nucleoside-diphosphate-sugar epimerase
MRILVTGATGFVGRWLLPELEAHGHEAIAAPASETLDIRDQGAVQLLLDGVRPAAVVHLAGMANPRAAAVSPEAARAINETGTRHVVDAAAGVEAVVLISGSSEVYGNPASGAAPFREDAPTNPTSAYGLSKLAQERVAIERGAAHKMPVCITRSFNHTGPGQPPDYVVPGFVHRVIEAVSSGSALIRVGNLDVRRDIGDVRDVVRAYRLLVERLAARELPGATVVNVATGYATLLRDLLGIIAGEVGFTIEPRVDPQLVRPDDPPVIVGDPDYLHELTGWRPNIPLAQTVRDMVDAARRDER